MKIEHIAMYVNELEKTKEFSIGLRLPFEF